jgi:hypothetical protein
MAERELALRRLMGGVYTAVAPILPISRPA